MAFLGALFFWNVRLSVVFGFLTNLLLVWLIAKKTPKEMRVHSRILLQTVFVDILMLLTSAITQIMTLSHEKIDTLFLDGFFAKPLADVFGIFALKLMAVVRQLFFDMNMLGVSVQFLYRYLVLNRDRKITLLQYLLMLAVPFAVLIVGKIMSPLTMNTVGEGEGEFFANIFGADYMPQFYFTYTSESILPVTIYKLSTEFAAYIVVFYCGIQMIRHVKSHNMSQRTKMLNRQLTRNLIILAIIPLLFIIHHSIGMTFVSWMEKSVARDLSQQHSGMLVQGILVVPSFWLPVLNPLATIVTNTPYRVAIKKYVKFGCFKPVSSSVHP